MIEKLERDGQVAVLVSPGFGAGWSTWHRAEPKMLFDPEIAQAIIDKNYNLAKEIADRKYHDIYFGGMDDLVVVWLPKGTRFEITEYDGNESLRILSPDDGFVA